MIIKEAIGVGSTVEEAREDAISKLNADIDQEVQFDIVSFPKKKVLGMFGGSDAKVRAYVEGADPVKSKTERAQKPASKKTARPAKAEVAKTKPVKEEPKKEEQPQKAAEPVGIPANEVDPSSPAGKAYKYISGVLAQLGCDGIGATVAEIEGGSKIALTGSDKLGVIIGRRGETLDALQYLASLVANENCGGYYRIVIDIGNYRERREGTLEALAKRTAAQVLRTGRNRSLEPMNPYERRIIHTAIQEIEGVSSASIGDGSNRRVVICPEGKSPRPYNGRSKDGRDGSRARQGFSGRAARTTTSAAPIDKASEKPKEVDGTKLYGKLGK